MGRRGSLRLIWGLSCACGMVWGERVVAPCLSKEPHKAQARALLKSLILCMGHSQGVAMNDWGRALHRWQEYILNYFDHLTTNASAEGVHTEMKLMKRMSSGFKNVEVYIKKCSFLFSLSRLFL